MGRGVLGTSFPKTLPRRKSFITYISKVLIVFMWNFASICSHNNVTSYTLFLGITTLLKPEWGHQENLWLWKEILVMLEVLTFTILHKRYSCHQAITWQVFNRRIVYFLNPWQTHVWWVNLSKLCHGFQKEFLQQYSDGFWLRGQLFSNFCSLL